MRADKSALGTLPTMAFRHCEPVRTASAFGWYVFPPEDIRLRYNGADVFILEDGAWRSLVQAHLPGFAEHWDAHAPADMRGLAPPHVTLLPAPGVVQIWSGFLCSSREGWSVLVRPIANLRCSNLFMPYEGIVESDQFKPFPLFINIQLVASDIPIELRKINPLFQVQPLLRESYGEKAHRSAELQGLSRHDGETPMSAGDWAGFRKAIRIELGDDKPPESGQYTVATRKRAKSGEGRD
jgi:hypothetical protein